LWVSSVAPDIGLSSWDLCCPVSNAITTGAAPPYKNFWADQSDVKGDIYLMNEATKYTLHESLNRGNEQSNKNKQNKWVWTARRWNVCLRRRSAFGSALWPWKHFSAIPIPTHKINVCDKFHWNPSNTWRDIAESRKRGVNGKRTDGRHIRNHTLRIRNMRFWNS